MKVNEMMHKNVSDSMANLIDIQELAGRPTWKSGIEPIENATIIQQEAGKIIQALRELEQRLPEEE